MDPLCHTHAHGSRLLLEPQSSNGALQRLHEGREAQSAQTAQPHSTLTQLQFTGHAGHPSDIYPSLTLLSQITKCPSTPVVANDFTAPGTPATMEMWLQERGMTVVTGTNEHSSSAQYG